MRTFYDPIFFHRKNIVGPETLCLNNNLQHWDREKISKILVILDNSFWDSDFISLSTETEKIDRLWFYVFWGNTFEIWLHFVVNREKSLMTYCSRFLWWHRLFSHECKVRNLNDHSNCAIGITQCTHERSNCDIWITRCTHERPNLGLAFRSGRRMSGYPANQTCMELAFPVLLYIHVCSARYIGGSG